MDFIRFAGPEPTYPSEGYFIPGITSAMWIERYRNPGEFTIKGRVSSGLRENLPVGSLISHLDTDVPMIVENQQISDDNQAEPEVVITGRSFETILEQRLIGANMSWAGSVRALPVYTMATDYAWFQARDAIYDHIRAAELINDDSELPNVEVHLSDTLQYIAGDLEGAESLERSAQLGSLHAAIIKLLEINNLGFGSTWRPWTDTYLFVIDKTTMRLRIYLPTDRSGDVRFSHDYGDIQSAEYLWTNKLRKNVAIVKGRWMCYEVESPLPGESAQEGYERRYTIVDGSDLDSQFSAAPTVGSPEALALTDAMFYRGKDALRSMTYKALAAASINPQSRRYLYRKDYWMGDYVTLDGDYDESKKVQVVEYVEIDDETGESGYPTFAPAPEG